MCASCHGPPASAPSSDLLGFVFSEVLILNNVKYTVKGYKLSPTHWCVICVLFCWHVFWPETHPPPGSQKQAAIFLKVYGDMWFHFDNKTPASSELECLRY